MLVVFTKDLATPTRRLLCIPKAFVCDISCNSVGSTSKGCGRFPHPKYMHHCATTAARSNQTASLGTSYGGVCFYKLLHSHKKTYCSSNLTILVATVYIARRSRAFVMRESRAVIRLNAHGTRAADTMLSRQDQLRQPSWPQHTEH